MPDASPAKWHLAHTSWFFETFVLGRTPGYRELRPEYAYLFNSYYDALGPRVARRDRGLLTRPALDEVREYRDVVTERLAELLTAGALELDALSVVELGIQHEQQHQELILTDIKHLLGHSPLAPAYHQREPADDERSSASTRPGPASPAFDTYEGGLVPIGRRGAGFAFDNEGPEHLEYLQPYVLGRKLVTNAEYLDFVRDGGYERPELWLSDGFRWLTEQQVGLPLYWRDAGPDGMLVYTLSGTVALSPDEPVCHVSYYEADAYARWRHARLPTEAEWEHAARPRPVRGNLLESDRFHPTPATEPGSSQFFGDTWEWTQSAYGAYPGFQPLAGALGEYNGKFMCNQMVLRGGSCATPGDHVRASYRNFFSPAARWQFSGIRLARFT